MHDNQAFDFETVQGQAVLCCFSDGTVLKHPTLDQMLSKLTRHNRKRRYFAWNIQFDCDAFLKELPLELIGDLVDAKPIQYKEYELNYLNKVNLKIKKGKKVIKVWDIAQFYMWHSLDSMAKQYLSKDDYKIDTEVVEKFKTTENNITYFTKHQDEIVEYCLNDARITKLLTDRFEHVCDVEGYDFQSPFSLGNLGMKYFAPYLTYVNGDNTYQIPRISGKRKSKNASFLANFESVYELIARGGWNDVFKRGKFYDVYDYDIVSAYPSIMKTIPYWDGEWINTLNEEEVLAADYGLVQCKIKNLSIPDFPSIYYYNNISFYDQKPMKWKNHSMIHCEVNKRWYPCALTLDHYKYLKSKADVHFEGAIILEPNPSYIGFFPLKKPTEELFKRKKEAEKPSIEREIAKKLMNSTSGKFKQKKHTKYTWWIYPHVYSKITRTVKETVLDLIEQNNAWKDVISVSTDGAVFNRKLSNVDLSGKLGGWECEEFENFVQVGNGIYYSYNEEENGKVKDYNQKIRGFNLEGKVNLKEALEKDKAKTIIPVSITRPIHLKEAYKHNKVLSIKDVNKFVVFDRHLDINKEIKRVWSDEFKDINDLLSGRVLESKAWEIRNAPKGI